MKKIEIVSLYEALHSLAKLSGVKFSYGVTKNINILKPEVEALEKAMEGTEKYKAYDLARQEIAKKYSKKDEDGNPVIKEQEERRTYVIEDRKSFNKEIESLQVEYKEVLEERKAQEIENEALMQTETDIELYKIKMSDVPEEISVQQMAAIYQIIEE